MVAFSPHKCMSIVLIACSAMTAVAQRSFAGPQYVKKATWTETMLAARAAGDREGQELGVKLGTWQATGPLKAKGFADSFFPEKGVDLRAKGPDGTPLWQPRPQWTDGQTQELPSLGGSEATYLFRTITAKRPTTLTCSFSSDDGIIVWLNGQKLLSREVVTTEAAVDLPLASGENRLLVKIHNYTGGYSYAFAMKGESTPASLWQAIKTDFPVQAGWFERHLDGRHLAWFRAADNASVQQAMIERSFSGSGPGRRHDARRVRAARQRLAAGRRPAMALALREGLPVPLSARRVEGRELGRVAAGRRGPGQDPGRPLPPRRRVPCPVGRLRKAGGRPGNGRGPGRRPGGPAGRWVGPTVRIAAARGPVGQPAVGFRPALAGQAQGEPAWAAAELAGQLLAAHARLRQRDRRDVAGAARRAAQDAVPAQVDRVRRRPDAGLRRTQDALDDVQAGAMGYFRDRRRRPRPAPGHGRRAQGRGQLLRVLPAGRPDHLHLDPLLPRGSLRRRRRQGGELVPHGRRRRPCAAALLRPGSRLVSDGAQQRPHPLHPLGIQRFAPLLHAALVPHEPGRDGAGRVLRHELVLAELHVLRPADPQPSDAGGGRDLRPPRRASHGRIGRLRSGPGTAPLRRRRAADPRLRPQGQSDHHRRPGRRLLAEVPPPHAAERQVLPRFRQAGPAVELGHLPGRYFRQHAAVGPAAGLRAVRADPAQTAARAARHSRPGELETTRRAGVHRQHLPGQGPAGRAQGDREEAADLRAALCLSGHGRAHQHRHRRALGRPADLGHRAGRGRRVGQFPRAGRYAPGRPAAGRRRQSAAGHAELVHGHAGRGGLLRRLPREPEQFAAHLPQNRRAASAVGHRVLVRPAARVQLQAGSATRAG